MSFRDKKGRFIKGERNPYFGFLELGRKWKKDHKLTDAQKKERGWYYENKQIMYWRNCDWCGEEYRGMGKNFCSTSCMRYADPIVMRGEDSPMKRPEVREKFSGKNNWNWKGGITSDNQKFRASPEYKQWRKAVFERDDYRCLDCGERGGILHADHIYPFSLFPRLRLELDNGRTLCRECHKNTDTYLSRVREFILHKI